MSLSLKKEYSSLSCITIVDKIPEEFPQITSRFSIAVILYLTINMPSQRNELEVQKAGHGIRYV
jgi:hypothetical protein